MSKQVLHMKYHPAKKEVEFRRFQSGKEMCIDSNSKLTKYMNQRGTFILQNYGNQFFNDIAEAFDGEKKIDIKVMTTEIDYDDFCQMVEEYNKSKQCKCRFSPQLVSKLPDMSQTFEEVKTYGQESIGKLECFRNELTRLNFKNDNVKKIVSRLDNKIKDQITEIKDKIERLKDNKVNLCFTGVYSSGKSTLINALLGYKILPENIKSETAKMIEICSPKRGEKVKIKFKIYEELSEIEWNENKQCFEFIKGPSECDVGTKLQNQLNDLRSKKSKQHEQIYGILKELNSEQFISSTIEVFFPIALDNEKFQFKIFDTPGADSNCPEHQMELQKALKEQTQSILIFVATPDRLEGEGNNSLLNGLTEAVQKSSKTSIDIARSLFVINKADTIEAYEREDLQSGEIKSQGNTIKLNDKKLFFISAKNAYAAKSIKNNIADKRERQIVKRFIPIDEEEILYKQNQCATSNLATKKLIGKCDNALQEAEQKEKDEDIVWISSGLYALENEIIQYAEKFASSVKAFAIIDSMDKVVTNLTQEAESLIDDNHELIEEVESQINKLENCNLNKVIKNITNNIKNELDNNRKNNDKFFKDLGIDTELFYTVVIKDVEMYIYQIFGNLHTIKVGYEQREKILEVIKVSLDGFNNRCTLMLSQLLLKKQREIINNVKKYMNEYRDIAEIDKMNVFSILNFDIKTDVLLSWNKSYKSYLRIPPISISITRYFDQEVLIDDIGDQLINIGVWFFCNFEDHYYKVLESLIEALENYFNQTIVRRVQEIKTESKYLGLKIKEIIYILNEIQLDFNMIVWG